jgi:hypothetical protein
MINPALLFPSIFSLRAGLVVWTEINKGLSLCLAILFSWFLPRFVRVIKLPLQNERR